MCGMNEPHNTSHAVSWFQMLDRLLTADPRQQRFDGGTDSDLGVQNQRNLVADPTVLSAPKLNCQDIAYFTYMATPPPQ